MTTPIDRLLESPMPHLLSKISPRARRASRVASALRAALPLGLLAPALLCAQTTLNVVPDAGQILQQNRSLPQPPAAPVPLPVPTSATDSALPGGAQVQLKAVQFSGNQILSTPALQALVADALGQRLDLAGLRAVAERVGAHYRRAGYLFARAYLPPQDLAQGVLRIEVLEGRYGQPRITSQVPGWATAAQPYLAPLQPDDVIARSLLERVTLLISDLPGVTSLAVMQPGDKVGTGDLVVEVARADAFTGSLSLDNHGNRYSGQYLARLGLDWQSPFQLGDRLSLRTLASDNKLWLGSLTYSADMGAAGWRGTAALASTRYELGREFAAVGATGSAQVFSVGGAYALLRSNAANVKLSATFQRKQLRDTQGPLRERKSSSSAVLQADFDQRDAVGAGGITYGNVSFTPGRMSLEGTDVNQTAGSFSKLNLDVVRLQALSAGLTAYGRVAAQWSNKNLDSSERMWLGGINGVRAYPSGEGNGDQGWLAQAELRATLGRAQPYVFADAGRVRVNAKPVNSTVDNARSVAGAGLGARMQWQGVEMNGAVAWQTQGGKALADGGAGSNPRWWVSAAYRF